MAYWAHDHKCVSCQHWSGKRKIAHDPRQIECVPGTKGTCRSSNSQYHGKKVDCSLYVGGERCFQLWSSAEE